MKRYERPVVLMSYSTRELREEAAAVVAASLNYGGYDWYHHNGR